MKIYNKLVRDKIPEILDGKGVVYQTKILSGDAYKAALFDKLDEETLEFKQDYNLEELADVMEVVDAFAQLLGADFRQVLDIKNKKAHERGAFTKKICLESTED